MTVYPALFTLALTREILPFYIPLPLQRYPFWAEPPLRVHNRDLPFPAGEGGEGSC